MKSFIYGDPTVSAIPGSRKADTGDEDPLKWCVDYIIEQQEKDIVNQRNLCGEDLAGCDIYHISNISEKYIKFDGLVDNVRKILAEEKRKSRQASLRSASTSDSDPMATYDLL